ncbi:hypothetical protein KL918_002608 [Ogataea parapolymorpha]|nr:hypothetical protein KL918_002608 [Ogataea parapolymorpha]KAG7870869.1 hypothetical protein KL916_004600 [Ogataea parapolymorpha]
MSSAQTKTQPRQPWAAAIAAKPPARTAKPAPKTQAAGYVPVNNFNSQQLQTALAAKFKQIEAQVGPGGVYHGSPAWTTKNKKRKGLDVLAELSKNIEQGNAGAAYLSLPFKIGTGITSRAYIYIAVGVSEATWIWKRAPH